jgi:hypothetical protein
MRAYDTEECTLLAKSLDHAWELYLKSKRLTAYNLDLAKGAIAYAVMDVARKGGDPRQIAKAAMTRVSLHEQRLQAERAIRREQRSV